MSDITFNPTFQAARKRHICDHCAQPIAPGQQYMRVRGIWEGTPGVFRAHDDCHEASRTWRDHHDAMWYEACLLCSDVEPEDHQWIVAEYPEVAERLNIAAWARPEFPGMMA